MTAVGIAEYALESDFDELVRNIFDTELGDAVSGAEIGSAIDRHVSDLDAAYLRSQCAGRYPVIREKARREESALRLRWSYRVRALRLGLAYQAATAPYVLRAAVIVATGTAILAFAQPSNGPYKTYSNGAVLIAAACLGFLALITPMAVQVYRERASGSRYGLVWVMPRLQAALLGIAIGVTSSAILDTHTLTHAQAQHRPGLIGAAITWLLLVPSVAMAFTRTGSPSPGPHSVYGTSGGLRSDPLSAGLAITGFAVAPVVVLAAGRGRVVVITAAVTARPLGLALVCAAAVLFLAIGALSAAGLWLQPLSVVEREYEAAVRQFREALGTQGILPFLREIINEREPLDTDVLSVAEAPGLDEQMDPLLQVSTASRRRVQSIIGRMPAGGSLGLAGPRGAGKSTVLRSYCGPDRDDQDALAVLLSAPVEYSSRDFLLHLYATLCGEALRRSGGGQRRSDAAAQSSRQAIALSAYGGILLIAGAFLILLQSDGFGLTGSQVWGSLIALIGTGFLFQAVPRLRSGLIRLRGDRRLAGVDATLADAAARRLEEIRFQQTISATWTGRVSLPAGFQGAFGGSQSLMRQAMLLPEIVDSLREFLELASREQSVYVGIDELDKMESDERARQFLNEIKGIFGARRCYFLVSVSEDAIASFERRGIPFRDVFDSSFDEIVRVPCLSLSEAQALLDRRVTQVPVPFKQFCFCLSGGLSRDLIRAARSVFEARGDIVSAGGEPKLLAITSRVLALDLAGKVEAISAAVARLDAEPQASEMLQWIRRVRVDRLGEDSAGAEIGAAGAIDLSAEADGERAAALASLRRLAAEFSGYCYYIGTLLDLFAPRGHRNLPAAPGSDGLDRLVVGRQLFTVSALVAWDEISAYRQGRGLAPVAVPASLRGPAPFPANGRPAGKVPVQGQVGTG